MQSYDIDELKLGNKQSESFAGKEKLRQRKQNRIYPWQKGRKEKKQVLYKFQHLTVQYVLTKRLW
jgi:hypothetical protein